MGINFHDNAAALIIAAAKQSGLLDEVARALCLCDKVPNPTHMDCPACELLSDLADHFGELKDDNAVGNSLEQFYGELAYEDFTEAALQPYFHVPFEMHVETRPPRFSIDFTKLFDVQLAKAEIESARVKFLQQIEANRDSASPE